MLQSFLARVASLRPIPEITSREAYEAGNDSYAGFLAQQENDRLRRDHDSFGFCHRSPQELLDSSIHENNLVMDRETRIYLARHALEHGDVAGALEQLQCPNTVPDRYEGSRIVADDR